MVNRNNQHATREWEDLPTGYNGRNITSDIIGNTLSDGNRINTYEIDPELTQ